MEGQGFLFAREGGRGGVCVIFVEDKVIWYNWYRCRENGNAKGYEKSIMVTGLVECSVEQCDSSILVCPSYPIFRLYCLIYVPKVQCATLLRILVHPHPSLHRPQNPLIFQLRQQTH